MRVMTDLSSIASYWAIDLQSVTMSIARMRIERRLGVQSTRTVQVEVSRPLCRVERRKERVFWRTAFTAPRLMSAQLENVSQFWHRASVSVSSLGTGTRFRSRTRARFHFSDWRRSGAGARVQVRVTRTQFSGEDEDEDEDKATHELHFLL